MLTSDVRLFAAMWTVVCLAPLSIGFSRQEYWSGLPCLLREDLPDLGIEATSVPPALQADFLTTVHWRRKWQPTPVFLPGEAQGWGRTESDATEVT